MDNNFKFMFLRSSNGHPVACVAMDTRPRNGEVRFQISTLNPADQFNRKLAREIALGRLVSTPVKIFVGNTSTHNEVLRSVVSCIANSDQVPTRAQRAARKWVDNSSMEVSSSRDFVV